MNLPPLRCGNCGEEIAWDVSANTWMHPDYYDLNRYLHCHWDAPLSQPWPEHAPVAELEMPQRRIL